MSNRVEDHESTKEESCMRAAKGGTGFYGTRIFFVRAPQRTPTVTQYGNNSYACMRISFHATSRISTKAEDTAGRCFHGTPFHH